MSGAYGAYGAKLRTRNKKKIELEIINNLIMGHMGQN